MDLTITRSGYGNYRQWITLVIIALIRRSLTFECTVKCKTTITRPVILEPLSHHCHLTLPDNPHKQADGVTGRIIPCQVEITANCSGQCVIELLINKLDLRTCHTNLSAVSDHCELVNDCEYVLLHDNGERPQLEENESPPSDVTHLHGTHTNTTYRSATDSVRLQFCYRSETFSGRNIQIAARTIKTDQHIEKTSIYFGHALVYILCCMVVIMSVMVGLLIVNSRVVRCLDKEELKPADL